MWASIGKWLGEMALSWLTNFIVSWYQAKKRKTKRDGITDEKTDKILKIADEIKEGGGKATPEQKRRLINEAKNSRTYRS
jgi:hypothetical protein